MDFEFETKRTYLANAFAAAGAELLGYLAITDTAVAAISDTQPQKYAVAGTLNGILSMAGKMMGEDGVTGLEGLTRWEPRGSRSSATGALMHPSEDGTWLHVEDVELLLAAPAAVEHPTGDLPPLPWGDDFEAWLEPLRQKDVASAMHDYARAAIASNIASQPTGDLTDEQITDIACAKFIGYDPLDVIDFARAIARAAIAARQSQQADRDEAASVDLHNAIMNIPAKVPESCARHELSLAYKIGHRDARHVAAELALEGAHLARQAQAEPVATEDINRLWDKAIEAESISNQLRREKEGLLAALRAVTEAPSQAVSIADTALLNYE